MTLIKFVSVLALTTTVGAVTSAYAAPDQDRFPINIDELETRQAERFGKLDLDGDAIVSLEEFEAAKLPERARGEKFRHAHRDHPGANRKNRNRYQADARREARKEMRKATSDELFTLLDTNADGTLSKAEYGARTKAHMQSARKRAAFARLDQNGDGGLDQSELAHRTQRLKQADADGDGEVTRRELHTLRRSQRQD